MSGQSDKLIMSDNYKTALRLEINMLKPVNRYSRRFLKEDLDNGKARFSRLFNQSDEVHAKVEESYYIFMSERFGMAENAITSAARNWGYRVELRPPVDSQLILFGEVMPFGINDVQDIECPAPGEKHETLHMYTDIALLDFADLGYPWDVEPYKRSTNEDYDFEDAVNDVMYNIMYSAAKSFPKGFKYDGCEWKSAEPWNYDWIVPVYFEYTPDIDASSLGSSVADVIEEEWARYTAIRDTLMSVIKKAAGNAKITYTETENTMSYNGGFRFEAKVTIPAQPYSNESKEAVETLKDAVIGVKSKYASDWHVTDISLKQSNRGRKNTIVNVVFDFDTENFD